MEPSKGGERTLAWSIVHWRSVVLVGASVAGGLVLTSMVIGATPTVGGQAAAAPEALVAAAVVDPSTTVPVDPSTTESIPASTDVVAAPGPAPPRSPRQPRAQQRLPPGEPLRSQERPSRRRHRLRPPPHRSSRPSGPEAEPPPLRRASEPLRRRTDPAAPTTAAPTTAAPTTAAPTTAAPTTAAPTTAAPVPVALSYPSYTVSGVSSVSLQFDGSSICSGLGEPAGQLGLPDRFERPTDRRDQVLQRRERKPIANSMQPSRAAGSRSRPEANDEWTHTRRANRTAASQPWPVGGACRSSSGAVSTGCRAVAATPGCRGPDVCRDSAASSITHTPDFICCRGYERNSAGSAEPARLPLRRRRRSPQPRRSLQRPQVRRPAALALCCAVSPIRHGGRDGRSGSQRLQGSQRCSRRWVR